MGCTALGAVVAAMPEEGSNGDSPAAALNAAANLDAASRETQAEADWEICWMKFKLIILMIDRGWPEVGER